MKNFFLSRREQLGLSQRAIAVALNMTDSAVGSWERGEVVPGASIARLAKVYDVSESTIERELIVQRRAIEKRREEEASSAAK